MDINPFSLPCYGNAAVTQIKLVTTKQIAVHIGRTVPWVLQLLKEPDSPVPLTQEELDDLDFPPQKIRSGKQPYYYEREGAIEWFTKRMNRKKKVVSEISFSQLLKQLPLR